MSFHLHTSPLQQIHDSLLAEKGLELWIKRDELIHAEIQGNKWRKLKYNLVEARFEEQKTLLTFGGAWSNHIYAVAAAGKHFDFKTIGIIRGEPTDTPSETLQFAVLCGMDLHFMDRTHYREKENFENIESLKIQFGDFYLVPEGGTNTQALQGCAEIIEEIKMDFDFLCTAVGTGGTAAGLLVGLQHQKKLIGFSSLKGKDTLSAQINLLTHEFCAETFTNFSLNFEYHFGGYAKVNEPLIAFIKNFKQTHQIQLEPVYTGKMLYGIYDLIRQDFFPRGTRIVALHTGGLQGLAGYKKWF